MANDNNNNLKEISITGESPGQLLANQRNKNNLSEREAADALKISVSRLKSIEADDFSVFPSETYIKGHLKNYSRLLKYSEKEVLKAYESIRPTSDSEGHADLPEAAHVDNHHKRWWLVYGVLVLLALVWMLSYWLLGAKGETEAVVFPEREMSLAVEVPGAASSQQPLTKHPKSEVVLPQETLTQPNAAAVTDGFSPSSPIADKKTQADNDGGETSNKPLVVSKLTAAELVKTIKANEEQKEAEPEVQVVGDTLEFGFKKTSWVQVVDATGKVLFKGLNKPGAKLALNGAAPFKIVIGNVDGTSLVYNGEDVALDAPAGKNTMRLTLGG